MTGTFQKKEIIELLKVFIAGIESGAIEPYYAGIEEWYNCPSVDGNTRLSVTYGPKKREIGERQC